MRASLRGWGLVYTKSLRTLHMCQLSEILLRNSQSPVGRQCLYRVVRVLGKIPYSFNILLAKLVKVFAFVYQTFGPVS